ncbi:MAG: hypothetical protein HXY20_01995 [Acidobacteria bacterium]|nr:hypothetical protein [Acidobacteriota bacterium]
MIRRLYGTLILVSLAGLCGCQWRRQPEPPAIEAGLPLYPGARNALAPDRFSQRLLPQDRAKLVKAVIYETEDPPTKVISFYKENLKGKYQVLETKKGGLASAVFRVEADGQYRLLMITHEEDSGKTEIVIGLISRPQK